MKKITSKDKLLPTQLFFSYLYKNKKTYLEALYKLLLRFNRKFKYTKFKLIRAKNVSLEEMSTPPAQLSFICFLINIIKPKQILEIGTFIGNTTMHLSEAASKKTIVTSIEYGQAFAEIAKSNIKNNNFSRKIRLLQGNAADVLTKYKHRKYDFIYIDGGKEKYLEFALLAEKMLSQKGVILVDDVFFMVMP